MLLLEDAMDEVSISEFKAKCIGFINRVNKTKRPIRVTRHGKPLVEIAPVKTEMDRKEWIASMQGSAETLGDIISPATDEDDWEVLRD
jgi:prevent-host-death family protein